MYCLKKKKKKKVQNGRRSASLFSFPPASWGERNLVLCCLQWIPLFPCAPFLLSKSNTPEHLTMETNRVQSKTSQTHSWTATAGGNGYFLKHRFYFFPHPEILCSVSVAFPSAGTSLGPTDSFPRGCRFFFFLFLFLFCLSLVSVTCYVIVVSEQSTLSCSVLYFPPSSRSRVTQPSEKKRLNRI